MLYCKQAKAKGVHSDADRDQTVPDTRRSRGSCDMERGRARRRGLSAAGGADGGECGQLFPVAVVHRPCGGRGDGRDRRSVHPASEQRRTLRPYLQHELCGEGRRARPAYRRTARASQHGAGKGSATASSSSTRSSRPTRVRSIFTAGSASSSSASSRAAFSCRTAITRTSSRTITNYKKKRSKTRPHEKIPSVYSACRRGKMLIELPDFFDPARDRRSFSCRQRLRSAE